jgi:hypothetical protein
MNTDTDVTNTKRTAWAEAAIHLFTGLTGCDREDSLGDLLCDLMHWSEQHGFDFDLALFRAKGHFDAERDEEEMAALLDIKRLAATPDDSGHDPYTLLELIESKAIAVLAQAKGGAQ